MPPKKTIVVVLDKRDDKKNSVKFLSEKEGEHFSNLYVMNSGVEALGNPKAIKVTIEAA